MYSDQQALSVKDLCKFYPIYEHPRDRLLQAIWRGTKTFYKPFWALRDVSFSLNRGSTLGVMGRNGSGKSTLLQLICGTLRPTSGQIERHGRIGALLELGSGFNPEFTGIENVFLNAALLGLSEKETDTRLDSILSFADIGDFIHQPLKAYSSGMAVRLAFAVQAHTDPDILIVDEALAVGDELFQKKCYRRIDEMKESGCSILLVTHSSTQILQHCDQAMLIHAGRMRMLAKAKTTTSVYQRLCNSAAPEWSHLLDAMCGSAETPLTDEESIRSRAKAQQQKPQPRKQLSTMVSYEAKGIKIETVKVQNQAGEAVELMGVGEAFKVVFTYRLTKDLDHLCFATHIANGTGFRVTGQQWPRPGSSEVLSATTGTTLQISYFFRGGLLPGIYFVGGGVWQSHDTGHFLHRVLDAATFRIAESANQENFGACVLKSANPEILQINNSGSDSHQIVDHTDHSQT